MNPYYEKDGIKIYHGDCREVLPTLGEFDFLSVPHEIDEKEVVECEECGQSATEINRSSRMETILLTDPPYGLGERLKGGRGEWSTHFRVAPEWDKAPCEIAIINNLIDCCDASIIWGGNYYPLPIARCWLAWDKMQDHTGAHFEMAWTNLDLPTRMFRLSRVEAYSAGKVHPTQKPLSLMRWCLTFAPEAKTILDPFMGSGTTLVAAKLEGKQAVGIEINERYCESAAKRLQQGVLF